MRTFKQFLSEDMSVHDIALTKQEQIALRDHIAAKLRIEQKRVAYQQIVEPNRAYLVVYFVAEVPGLERDDAEFRAKLVAKSAEAVAAKMFDKDGKVRTTYKVIDPRQGQSIKIKFQVYPT